MRPFKMFFGLSLAIMLFFVVAKFFVLAFFAAAFMSIIYAVFRRLKDFITYDRYGEQYIKNYATQARMERNWEPQVEPLFYGSSVKRQAYREDIHFVDIH